MHEPEEKVYDEKDMSEFNAGIATLQRLHEIKKFLDISTATDDYDMQFKYLKCFYKELHPMMSEDDRLKHEEHATNCRKCLKKIKETTTATQDDYDSFDSWEVELREIEQKLGMNLPKKADARYALSKR